jgi:transposase, IS5 family
MYRKKSSQISFILPFGGELNSENRWVQLADILAWDEIEEKYSKNFKSKKGALAKSARVALGALIIKEMMRLTDEDVVETIAETPAMQYFLGFDEFIQELPFDPSSLVHFRKRLGAKFIEEINLLVVEGRKKNETRSQQDDKTDSDDHPPSTRGLLKKSNEGKETEKPQKKESTTEQTSFREGKIILDATCAPADIRYPTDLSLLNESREKSEEIIDEMFEQSSKKNKKPRTYRKKARKQYLNLARKKKLSKQVIRKGIGQQLRYLKRNLRHIADLNEEISLHVLSKRQYKNLLVIHELYRQQQIMYESKTDSIGARIVSVSQPYVRPIVRGKARASTEFGAKLSASVCSNGFVTLDRLSWEAFNESGDLEEQVEKYRQRVGQYPEAVLADKIYRTRANRKWCNDKGIRLSGPALGRPPKSGKLRKAQYLQNRLDEGERNAIEGKFGQGKRRFGLSKIMAKLQQTSETTIAMSFLVMNLVKLRELYFFLFFGLCSCLVYVKTESLKTFFIKNTKTRAQLLASHNVRGFATN